MHQLWKSTQVVGSKLMLPLTFYASGTNFSRFQGTLNRKSMLFLTASNCQAFNRSIFCTLSKEPHEILTYRDNIRVEDSHLNDELINNSEVAATDIYGRRNVLAAPKDTDLDSISPLLKPTFNLAAYADKSKILSEFIHLGVEIAKWEKHKDVCLHVLKLDFEKDIKPYIFFLNDNGVPADGLGRWLTINPFVFMERLENLIVRINYLESKKFNKEQIAIIINKVPNWINCSTQLIDKELGVYQKKFRLKGEEVRHLAVMDPKLILFTSSNKFFLERICIAVENELGFTPNEMKKMLLSYPRLYRTHGESLMKRFDVVHTQMGFSHETIAKFPKILGMRHRKLKERHQFLHYLGRNQYDPLKPGYVAPYDFIKWNDGEFCLNIAYSTISIYTDFLKTL